MPGVNSGTQSGPLVFRSLKMHLNARYEQSQCCVTRAAHFVVEMESLSC